MRIFEPLKELGILDYFHIIGKILSIGESKRKDFIDGKVIYEKELEIEEFCGRVVKVKLVGDWTDRRNEYEKGKKSEILVIQNAGDFIVDDIYSFN